MRYVLHGNLAPTTHSVCARAACCATPTPSARLTPLARALLRLKAGEELCPGSEGLDALRKQTAGASGLSDELTLDAVRQNLIRQEDSIIFALIERAQYKMNAAVYATETLGAQSLLEFTLREQERTFAKIRRYTDDVERAFFPEALPPAILPALSYPETLHPAARAVNLNAEVMALYLVRGARVASACRRLKRCRLSDPIARTIEPLPPCSARCSRRCAMRAMMPTTARPRCTTPWRCRR